MRQSIRVLVFMIMVVVGLFAQSTANKGELVGTVLDPNSAVVPGAKVAIRNTGTGFARQLTTDSQGAYRAVLLDPGSYEVTASANGFAEATVVDLPITVGSSISMDIVLQIQATSSSVEVGSTLINVALPAPTTTLNTGAISNQLNAKRK